MENFSELLALCEGNPLVIIGLPPKGKWHGALIFVLWSAPEQTADQTIEMPVIWDTIAPIMTSL